MKKVFWTIAFIVGLIFSGKAQNHCSCDKAVLIDTSSYGPVYADGVPYPTLAMAHTDGTYFEKPHTAVWFCIDIPYDTLLTFDLVPQSPNDDLDFLLFKDETSEIKNCSMCRVENKNFCNKIALQKIIPVRTNIARCDVSIKGMTGLSADAKNNMEPPGKHPTYSKAISVKKDERYYLVVDNYTSASRPFTLLIHFKFPVSEVESGDTIPVRNTIQPGVFAKGITVIKINDSLTKAPVKAKIKVSWIVPKQQKNSDTTAAQYGIRLKQGQKINITASTKGYLLSQLTYEAQTDSDKAIYVNMLRIREHMKMIFKHMEFERGEAKFLPSASESLNDLLEFMNNNPEVKILIKGFVNDPFDYYDQDFDMNLSKQRAQAVYNYLVSKGIDTKRLQWRGFGNKQMVYPKPANEDEMEANRRVEVEIVK
ncbi:MAG TPA: OmpA family protein [Bacteroidia bacterium]|jgi:outer membrane protein OmpA-like peptidoglycan-associated protein|nr:OmpA family protein [Bacteroidia bacterium]